MNANWNNNTNTMRGTTCRVRVYVPVANSVPVSRAIESQIVDSAVLSNTLGKDFMAHTPGGSDG